jgi:hypothetical protein
VGVSLRGSLEEQAEQMTVNADSLFNPQGKMNLASWNSRMTLRLVATDSWLQFADADLRAAYYIKSFGRAESQPGQAADPTRDFSVFRLDEAYVDFEGGEHWYVLVGKKRVNWGVGFFANPVDAINPLKDVRDPAHAEEGTPLALAEMIWGDFSLTGVYSRQIDEALTMRYHRGGACLSWLAGGVETKLYGFGGDAVKGMAGFSLRIPAGDFVIYGEGAERFGSDRVYFDDLGRPFEKTGAQATVLAGVSYSFGSNHSVMLEYLYDQRGYEADEITHYWDALERNPGVLGLLQSQLGAHVFRNYLGASVSLQKVRDVWDLSARVMLGLDQPSGLVVPGVLYRLTDTLTLQVEDQLAWGGNRTEYGNQLYRNQVNVMATLNF